MIEENVQNLAEDDNEPREIEGSLKTYDSQIENKLRPTLLGEYVGQSAIKANLDITLRAAKKRQESIEHTLLYGPPGLGKTTLGYIIANEMEANIKITSGPALEKQGDIIAILTNLKEGDVLFIDEIHRLKSQIEEILYSAMEDFVVDIIIGKGPSARSMRLTLPRFTLIGATTKVSMISSPLHDRFGNIYKLAFYEDEELANIIIRSSSILGIDIKDNAALRIASASRKTPRIANRLLKRARDYSDIAGKDQITLGLVVKTLDMLGIDTFGLDQNDRLILNTIIDKFRGGPVGLSTLAAATSEEMSTIEDFYEPFLLQLGFLERTPKGRKVTESAFHHLRSYN